MTARIRDEKRRTVTAFVASFTIALIAVGGLVVDGGYILAARQRAYDEADAAARVVRRRSISTHSARAARRPSPSPRHNGGSTTSTSCPLATKGSSR